MITKEISYKWVMSCHATFHIIAFTTRGSHQLMGETTKFSASVLTRGRLLFFSVSLRERTFSTSVLSRGRLFSVGVSMRERLFSVSVSVRESLLFFFILV
jgi:hypothetical protein